MDRPTFSASIDQGLQALWHLWIDHVDKRRVDPPSGFYRIEPANDDIELHVIVFAFVLDLSVVSKLMMSFRRSDSGVGAHGVTTTPGTRFIMNSAATVAFGLPTSLGLPNEKEKKVRG